MSRPARRWRGRSTSCSSMPASEPAAVFVRSLVVIEKGARAMLVESHEGSRRVPGERRARAQGRRRGPCRSHQDHRRGRGRAACLDADGGDRRACPLQRIPVHHRRRAWCATSCSCAFAGEGTVAGIRGASLLKGRQHADTTLVADHAVARLHQPRGVQVGARRREPRRLPGQDHRAAARAEDRRQDGDARAAAVGDRRGRQQARARNLRRRRAVRPRRDLGRSRRGPAVLPQGARHSGRRRPRRC